MGAADAKPATRPVCLQRHEHGEVREEGLGKVACAGPHVKFELPVVIRERCQVGSWMYKHGVLEKDPAWLCKLQNHQHIVDI